uniref:Uncharacterized protein n=1 Tax=Triticum urartu TaxID=4572 RepID=A0A8R7TPY5_TRIUA
PSLCCRPAVPVLGLRSPNTDEIDRIRRISRNTQPLLLIGHAGSTDELLVDIHPTAPPKTVRQPPRQRAAPTCHTNGRVAKLQRVPRRTRHRLCQSPKRPWSWHGGGSAVCGSSVPSSTSSTAEIELYKELEPSTRLLILKAICDIRVEIVRKLISLCREAIQGHEASEQVCAATCYCTNSLDRAPRPARQGMPPAGGHLDVRVGDGPASLPLQPRQSSASAETCSRRCWLSNLQCNPSLCRCLNHFVLLHNPQNIAAAAIYPLISWSDPNLGKPATCASNRM